jgi:uncharacterized protein (DUF1499 family)
MTAILLQRESKQARWSRRVAVFAAQIAVISLILHRLDFLGARVATNLLGVSAFGGLLALILAAIALIRIWRQGLLGGGHAVAGVIIGLLLLAGPLWYLPDLLTLPKINDISTDLQSPPKFESIASLRDKGANPVQYPGIAVSELQAEAYPDIRPMVLERSAEETFDLVHEAVTRLDWKIVTNRKPAGSGQGLIEAVSKTLVMGFADDIVIRVAAGVGEARIDVRSASRYGEHDFGANARRIRRLFTEVKAGLEKGERLALDAALAKRAKEARDEAKRLRKLRAKAKKEEEARLAVLREKARAEELKRLSELQREDLRIEQGLGLLGIPGEPVQRAPRRARAWNQAADKFWQQFGE